MGVLWFIVSLLLSPIILPIGMIFGFYKKCVNNSFKQAVKDIDNKFMSLAVSVDKFGNVACAELFNSVLIKRSKFLFGNHRQTISHVLGVNARSNNLTVTGRYLVKVLDTIDTNHSVKSIEE